MFFLSKEVYNIFSVFTYSSYLNREKNFPGKSYFLQLRQSCDKRFFNCCNQKEVLNKSINNFLLNSSLRVKFSSVDDMFVKYETAKTARTHI